MDDRILKSEEQAVFSLRSLYGKYGYSPYKMSKFEEYEYYIRNKDFLTSDRIITFNDTNGKLLALKPDVTLSIVKNGSFQPGCKQKVYYNENIYRVSERTGQYKELLQTGLECIGDINLYDIYETLSLAAQSLELIGSDFMIQISHLGILSGVLDSISRDREFRHRALACISGKNVHDLERLCREYAVEDDQCKALCRLVTVYGNRRDVLSQLEEICDTLAPEALSQLAQLSGLLDRQSWSDRVIFDFSVVNNMSYYNGIVFNGFLSGISDCILAGGQYDKLIHKLGRQGGAIGFAIYLDLLEELALTRREYDVDVLLCCGPDTSWEIVDREAQKLISEGKTVSVQQNIPTGLRYREIITL